MNDTSYREILESAANYNTRLCIERRLRLPFLDSQTGVAQNHSSLYMNKRHRMPGMAPGQIYTYPRPRWRKRRRQYLTMNSRAFARAADALLDGDVDLHNISQVENPALQDTDSKDSQLLLKDDVSKDWYYDEQDIMEMDAYDEPDQDSDLDYEETYSKRSKRRKGTGRSRGTDSPNAPGRRKGGGRGRKKTYAHNFDPTPGDPDKPFACELCGARYKTRPGLTYHYGHSHKEGASDENSRDSNAPMPTAPVVGMPNVPGGPPMPPGMGLPMGMGGPASLGGLVTGGPVVGDGASNNLSPAQGILQGSVYQDSYVSFLNQPNAGTPGGPIRRSRPGGLQPSPQSQAPPNLPPNLPNQPPLLPMDDPPMPILVAEKNYDPMPPVSIMDHLKDKAMPSPYCDFCLGDSRENKKTGGSEELVSCADCGRSAHPTCLQFTMNMIISVRKYRWQCIECKCCSVCGNSDNDDQLLFCDDCDRGYHMYCLSPPLNTPPEGSWSCKLCIDQFHK
ncbi:zinc finger protein ubi-d4 B-like isoform X2 [Photinus pyralis]|nr:zinc finger protein ubi-d4 B-like isoform X2 [Photinus pyralis]